MSSFLKGFGTLSPDKQVTNHPLSVQGQIPHWLRGSLIRNGPAQFYVQIYSFRHVFDGMAMLYRFGFEDGKVTFTNRFLRSKAYDFASKQGELKYPEFATEPQRNFLENLLSLLHPQFSDNASVNVTTIGGKHVALNEAPTPVAFDPFTLETLGDFAYNDHLRGITVTAHPQYDYDNKILYNVTTNFGLVTCYRVYGIKDGTRTRKVLAEIPVRHPAYMHSFAMTKNYIVLVEAPWRFTDIWGLIFQYKQPYLNDYEWQPGNPTIFTAISKKDGKVLKTWEADTFMALHNVNAFEKKDRLIVDLCAYKDNTLVNKLYFASLLQGDGGVLPPVQLRRYHLRLKSSVASYEVLSPEQADMPQINFMRFTSKPYRYMYGIGPASQIGDDFIDQLVKVDVQTTATKCWRQRECYPGEPVFVAKPDAKSEDEGVVLSLILDGEHNHSSLLVLDGQTFEEMGRINLPFLVPFGFHGAFYNNIV